MSVVWVMYQVEHVVSCMRCSKNNGLNIEDILPNLDNANHIRKN